MNFSELVKMTTDRGVLEFGVASSNGYVIFEQIIDGRPCNLISKKQQDCEFRLNTNSFSDYLDDNASYSQFKVIQSLKHYVRTQKKVFLK